MGRIQQLLICLIMIITIGLPSCKTVEVAVISQEYETRHINNIDAGFQNEGLFYSLPRTAIVIDIEVKKTTKTPGPYASYASRFLGLDDIITSYKDEFEIYRVNISNFAEPDPDQVFFVSFADQQTHEMFVSLNEAALIMNVNRPLIKHEILHGDDPTIHYDRDARDATFNYFFDAYQTGKHDDVSEATEEGNIAVQRQTLRRSWVEKSTELRAREVADYILEIREKKFDLISGFQEIAYSKEALKYMYDEMNKLESDYLDLFTGLTSHDIIQYRYVIRPQKKDIENGFPLFRLSSDEGILPLTSDTGTTIGLKFAPLGATTLLEQQITQNASPNQNDSLGFHYRIPEYTDISLYIESEIRAHTRMLVNQFGIVSHLPAKNLHIEFHPQTGSIKSVGFQE